MISCSKCGVEKPESSFYAKKDGSGFHYWCKDCRIAHRGTPERVEREREKAREWYRNNKGRALARKKKYMQTPEGQLRSRTYAAETRGAKKLLITARSRAKTRGIPFDIDLTDVVVPEVCPLLGIPLEFGSARWFENSPSLDRLDPTKGYVKGNVWVISHRANRLKMDATLAELQTLVANLQSRLSAVD